MSKVVKITDEIFERLQRLAVPLVDTSENVIERLINFYESHKNELIFPTVTNPVQNTDGHKFLDELSRRAPRQRGAAVKIGEETIKASSVSELYSKALEYLYHKGYIKNLEPHLPLPTSRKRYLVSQTPVHPNGNEFVVPVEYKGYFMEAGKDYKNAIRHLCKMLDYCGLTLTYIG